jgi:di/tricarboxylate transporter
VRAWLTAGIFGGSLVLAAFGVLPLAVAGFLGAFMVFVTRCVSSQDVYREVEWRVVILIACMLALGTAMESTGTAAFLAEKLGALMEGRKPLWLLGGFFVLTVLLTQPMSNQAAAAVVVPIAVAAANYLDLNPRPFVMMIAIAASCSYMTPLEPACMLVYGPGRYKFMDFVRVGTPLTVIVFGIALTLVPLIWPL